MPFKKADKINLDIHGVNDQNVTSAFILNRVWSANQWLIVAVGIFMLSTIAFAFHTFAFDYYKPRGAVDEQTDKAGVIIVTGWALESTRYPTGVINSVQMYIDKVDGSHYLGKAKYGIGAVKYFRPIPCGTDGPPPCPIAGWSYSLDTKKHHISDGNHTIIAKIIGKGKPNSRYFLAKGELRVENYSGGGRASPGTKPFGFIDNPAIYSSTTKSPILERAPYTFTGWAIDKESKIRSVDVLVGGLPIGAKNSLSGKAELGKGRSRPDICAKYKGYAGCPAGMVEWQYTVDLSKVPNDTTFRGIYVWIKITDSDLPDHVSDDPCLSNPCKLIRGGPGITDTFARLFYVKELRLVPNKPLGTIDNPDVTSPPINGIYNFNGWGLDSSATPITAIDHVTYSMDGEPTAHDIPYGTGRQRLDVCSRFLGRPGCILGQPNFGLVGWQFDYDTSLFSNGVHTVHVNIYDSDSPQNSATFDSAFTVDNATPPPPPPPTATNLKPDLLLESITPSNTITKVKGWALDNATKIETAVSKVDIYLDDRFLSAASYGGASNPSDICNSLPGRIGCPNVGFNYTFDSSKVYNGSHKIKAVATDDTGQFQEAVQAFTVTGNPGPLPPPPPPPPPGPVTPSTRSTVDRPADASVGNSPQIHVLYMTPSDGPDRQYDINGALNTSVAATQSWLSRQAGGRNFRYDTYNGGTQIDVTFVRAAHPSSYYSTSGMSITSLVQSDARSAGFGTPGRIYAIYFEGGSVSACGQSQVPGNYPALYFNGSYPGIGAPCNAFSLTTSASSPGYLDLVMLHEIMHSLGAVQPCAPHFTGFHTTDPIDLMEGVGLFPAASVVTLDPGGDDYFGARVLSGCLNISSSTYLK